MDNIDEFKKNPPDLLPSLRELKERYKKVFSELTLGQYLLVGGMAILGLTSIIFKFYQFIPDILLWPIAIILFFLIPVFIFLLIQPIIRFILQLIMGLIEFIRLILFYIQYFIYAILKRNWLLEQKKIQEPF